MCDTKVNFKLSSNNHNVIPEELQICWTKCPTSLKKHCYICPCLHHVSMQKNEPKIFMDLLCNGEILKPFQNFLPNVNVKLMNSQGLDFLKGCIEFFSMYH